MLTSLSLTNFRSFESLEIPKFARVNLIGGVNNAGKTGLLEAIYLLLERDGERLGELPSLFRAASGINEGKYFWRWLVRAADSKNSFTIVGNVTGFGQVKAVWRRQGQENAPGLYPDFSSANYSLWRKQLSFKDLQSWPSVEAFSPRPSPPIEDAKVFNQATRKSPDAEERIEDLLREIDPRVKRIRSYPDENTNEPLVHVGLDFGEAIPAPQLGQGFNRLLRIYSSLISAEAKVFLIDEVETGLHHSVLPTIWKGLAAVARKENVQIFATTHSREAIFAAHRVFSQEPGYDFAYHRLDRADGRITVTTYDEEALAGADESNFEVR
jgi:hypothetical protein